MSNYMQGDRKKIGIFIIVLGLLIILAIVYFIILKNKPVTKEEVPVSDGNYPPISVESTGEPVTSTSTPSDAPVGSRKYDINNIPKLKTTGDDLGKVAMSLAERFGSFSNQSNYGNFTDLKILMTDDMREWVDKYVEELRAKPQDDSAYYGITTQALTYKVIKFDDNGGEAEIMVSTRRSESSEAINGGAPYNQDLKISLLKVEGEWLFNKAYWVK